MSNRLLKKTMMCTYSQDIYEDFTESETQDAAETYKAEVDVEVQRVEALNIEDGLDGDLVEGEDLTAGQIIHNGKKRVRDAVKALPRPSYKHLVHQRLGIKPSDVVTTVVNADTMDITINGITRTLPITAHAESQRGID